MNISDTGFNMCCVPRGKSQDSPLDRRRNSIISRQLRDWKKSEDKTIKLLLLGCGESGKSTISKQMKIIHINGFTDSERLKRVKNIRKNVRDSILTILGAMHNLGIGLEDEKLQPSVDWIMQNCVREDFDYPKIFYQHVELLWGDEGVQSCYRRSNEYQLIDSAKYFIKRTKEIGQTDYSPTDQDMLRCRVITNSIHTIDFSVKDKHSNVHFNVYDVGGQRGQRRKWLQMFDCITAIIFVLDCSSYDLSLREDSSRNRMLEACQLFHQLWNNRWLQRVPMILFINKIDVLAEKVNSGHTLDQFTETISPDNPFYKHFQPFTEFLKSDGIKESEIKEFVNAFPLGDAAEDVKKSQSTLSLTGLSKRRSRQISLAQHVGVEIVKTAIFIKRVFMEIINESRVDEFGGDWHGGHDCEYYYTCAVDTRQIKKVLDSCRSLIIKKHLHGWGLSV